MTVIRLEAKNSRSFHRRPLRRVDDGAGRETGMRVRAGSVDERRYINKMYFAVQYTTT